MRPHACLAPAAVGLTLAVTLLLLGGCLSHDGPTGGRSPSRATPSTGAAGPAPRRAPRAPMTVFEKQVAGQLRDRLAASGMHLDYLDCPVWKGHVPARMSCRGYVDGLVTTVLVRLSASAGRHVGLDAWLADGLLSTRNLEATVRRLGWGTAQCGTAAAYRARVGTRITCRVTRGHRTSYVVATVRTRSGDVAVTPWAGGR